MGIATLHITEERRQEYQTRLDALKTSAERNRWGQFATPPELALHIARYARRQTGDGVNTFLDPAIGTGSFYSAVRQTFPPEAIGGATGIELDPLFAKSAEDLWSDSGLNIVRGDFTKLESPAIRFNLVLTNPPYVRHHHLAASEKKRLKMRLARSLKTEISGLAGLYCYFMLLCHDWMEEQGLAIWLVPSEFMDVNYGATLRQYLSERVTLLHIHRFCPTDVQFTDALVSSAVVVFRKALPSPTHRIRFSLAGPIDSPHTEILIPLDVLRRSGKWTQFPIRPAERVTGDPTLGEIFTIKRGLATGSNSFFIMTSHEADERQIPHQFLKPILPGPRNVTADIIEALPDGSPDVSPRLYLLDCKKPEAEIKSKWPRLHEYLLRGRLDDVHNAYLSSHRAPWYSQEQRPPAPFLCTYMGRGKHPFRFIWNRSQATAHNVYLMLYPKKHLQEALTRRPELEANVFEALRRITPQQLLSEGRVYGGGLHKVEPKELAQIPARAILEAFPQIDFQLQRSFFV
jgi:adenine-specific DNA-methyltransferase